MSNRQPTITSKKDGDAPVNLVDGNLPKGLFAMFCFDSFYLERAVSVSGDVRSLSLFVSGWRTFSISFGMSSAKRSLSVWGFVEANLRGASAARARGERTWSQKTGMSLLVVERGDETHLVPRNEA
jgi:hypothetical protein